MAGIAGALIGAGSQLLGGLLGGNKFKSWQLREQYRAGHFNERERYKATVEGAKAAGLNPLTALGVSGGASGLIAGGQSAPPLASIQMITGAAQTIGDIISGKTAQDNAQQQLDMDLQKLQIEQMRAVASQPALIPGAPRIGNQTRTGAANPAMAVPAGASPSDPSTPRSTLPIKTPFGDVRPLSGFSDAEVGETRYGEIAGELLGLPALAADIFLNATGYRPLTVDSSGLPGVRVQQTFPATQLPPVTIHVPNAPRRERNYNTQTRIKP